MIICNSVNKYYYSKKNKIHVIKNIDLKIDKGDIVGYIGRNGAGKSTTIKLITGILHPDSGTITTNSLDPFKDRKKYVKEIGVVFGQRNQLFWDLKVKDSFIFNKSIYNVSEDNFNQKLKEFETFFNFDEIYNKSVRKLSLGQRVKANIALAFLHSPKIVFLDEPTIGLDVLNKEDILKYIKYINNKENTTILITSHDLNDISTLSNKIILLEKGSIEYNGSYEEFIKIYGKRDLIRLYFKEDDSDMVNIISYLKTFENIDVVRNFNTLEIYYDSSEFNNLQILNLIKEYESEFNNFEFKKVTLEDVFKKIYSKVEN